MDSGPIANTNIYDTYIYKAMDRNLGVRTLEKKAAAFSDEKLKAIKDNKIILWHIRESNEPGMLAIDYIYWNDKGNKWNNGSKRMALTNDGWVSAVGEELPKARSLLKALTSEQVGEHEQSLRDYTASIGVKVDDNEIKHFDETYRINPSKEEQTQSQLYSAYLARNTITLDLAMRQAVTCEITGVIFDDPVVMNKDLPVKIGDMQFNLKKGRSYERNAILGASIMGTNHHITSHDFYPNFTLSKCINRLGAPMEKLETLVDDFTTDVVLGDVYEYPMIIPSGHSFNSDTLDGMIASGRTLMCPLTRTPFTKEQIIPNTNLDRFVKTWPDYLQRQRSAAAEEDNEENKSPLRKPKL